MIRFHPGPSDGARDTPAMDGTVGRVARYLVQTGSIHAPRLYGPSGVLLHDEDACPADVYSGTVRPDIPPLTLEKHYVQAYLHSVCYGEDPDDASLRQPK